MSVGGGEGETLELALHPSSDRFDGDDERWQEQVSLLFQELQREVGGVAGRRSTVQALRSCGRQGC